MAYRQAKIKGAGRKKQDGAPNRGGDKVREDGQTLSGLNRRTGRRSRCYRCDSEYHLAPRRPWRDTPRGGRNPVPRERDKARRPSYSSISMHPQLRPEKWNAWRRRSRRRANMPFPRRRLRATCFGSRRWIAWWCWTRAQEPILYPASRTQWIATCIRLSVESQCPLWGWARR